MKSHLLPIKKNKKTKNTNEIYTMAKTAGEQGGQQ